MLIGCQFLSLFPKSSCIVVCLANLLSPIFSTWLFKYFRFPLMHSYISWMLLIYCMYFNSTTVSLLIFYSSGFHLCELLHQFNKSKQGSLLTSIQCELFVANRACTFPRISEVIYLYLVNKFIVEMRRFYFKYGQMCIVHDSNRRHIRARSVVLFKSKPDNLTST